MTQTDKIALLEYYSVPFNIHVETDLNTYTLSVVNNKDSKLLELAVCSSIEEAEKASEALKTKYILNYNNTVTV